MTNNIDRTNNSGKNIGMVLSPEAIEIIKDELVAECTYADMVIDRAALRERLFQEYAESLKTPIVPADFATATVSNEPDFMGPADFLYNEEDKELLSRQEKACKVRLRRRSAYMAKKAIGCKAKIAGKSKRSRWLDDLNNHSGFILLKGSEAIQAGHKGSKTERAWRLKKKAERLGMTGKVTT